MSNRWIKHQSIEREWYRTHLVSPENKAISQKSLLDIMEEASQEAIANGMTPEILESILNNEN